MSTAIYQAALAGFEHQLAVINEQIQTVRAAMSHAPEVKTRNFSAQTRRRMSLAQKKRWSRHRK